MADKEGNGNQALLPATHASARAHVELGSDEFRSGPTDREFINVAKYILVCELCERLAFYGIIGNLVIFFTDVLHHDTPTADAWTMIFSGTCYLTPLLGGWLADTSWDRYHTILRFSSVYFVGLVLLAFSSVDAVANDFTTILALFLVALGTGGIKSSVSVLGAEQTSDSGQQQKFFNYFYWAINVGSLVAFTAIATIQQNINFTVGYSIPAAAMGLAVASFWSGRRMYRVLPPQGSVLGEVASAAWTATKHGGLCNLPSMRRSAGGPIDDHAVYRLRAVFRVMPIMATFVVYWLVYSQMSSTFLNQGKYMSLKFGAAEVPVAFLQSFDTIIILILVPIFDRYLYPWLKRKGIRLTMLRRIGLGYIFTVLAMVIACMLEARRLDTVHAGQFVHQKVAKDDIRDAADLSIFWQVPQFLCIGMSEVLASISGLEFAYDQAPKSLRGVIMALFLLATAFGSYSGAIVISIVNAASEPHPWIADKINDGRLDLYFLVLAGIAALNLAVFAYLAVRYRGIEGASRQDVNEEEAARRGYDEPPSSTSPMSPAPLVAAQAYAQGERP